MQQLSPRMKKIWGMTAGMKQETVIVWIRDRSREDDRLCAHVSHCKMSILVIPVDLPGYTRITWKGFVSLFEVRKVRPCFLSHTRRKQVRKGGCALTQYRQIRNGKRLG